MSTEDSVQQYIEFEAANPLPDLGDILLSNENFCDVDLSQKSSQSELQECFTSEPGICHSMNACDIDSYTNLLHSTTNCMTYSEPSSIGVQYSTNTTLLQPILKSSTTYSVKDVNLNDVSDSAAEEEFLYQLNLSKCDKLSPATSTSNSSPNKPNTRGLSKLKCARLNGTKTSLKKENDKCTNKRRITLREKISRVKVANHEQQKAMKSAADKMRMRHGKSLTGNFTPTKQDSKKFSRPLQKKIQPVTGVCRLCDYAYSCLGEREEHLSDPDHIIKSEVKSGTNFQFLDKEAKEFSNIRMPAQCPVCAEAFSKVRELLVHHRRSHSKAKPFQCVRCSVAFYRRCDLLGHIRKHLGIKKYQCSACPKSFDKQLSLTSHLISQHGHSDTRPRNYKCTECAEAFMSKQAVNQHMHTHTGYNAVTCNICGRGFRSSFALEAHLRVHSGEMPFKCEQCSYTSKTKQLLQRHLRSHTGSKPFKCTYCPFKCASTAGLKRHILLHTGSKPFRCPYCEYRCTNIENLRKHIKRTQKHVGLNIYPCLHCSFSCDERTEYIRHLKQQHFPQLSEDNASAAKLSGIFFPDSPPSTNASDPCNAIQTDPCDVMQSEVICVIPSNVCDVIQHDVISSDASVTSSIHGVQPMSIVQAANQNSDASAIETLILDGANHLFQSSSNINELDHGPGLSTEGGAIERSSPVSMNGLDGSNNPSINGLNELMLNALIKIPNLQKVILPQGDGNAPITLVIGSEYGSYDVTEDLRGQNQQQITSKDDVQLPLRNGCSDVVATVPSGDHERYIISSNGIEPYPKI